MDLWVVAAAAGAGYLTKYWQNLSRNVDKDGLLQLSFGDANVDKPESPSHPFRRLTQRKKCGDDVSADRKLVSDERLADVNRLESACGTEVASTSGYDGENLGGLVNYKDFNLFSLSSVSPAYSGNDHENRDGTCPSNHIDDRTGSVLPTSPNGERGSLHVPLRNRSSIRTERSYGHIVKPVNSLESCLMAQWYKERAEMEERVLSLPSPSTPSMRPLFVTDGSRIISRASGDHFSTHIGMDENLLQKEAYLENNKNACRVPPPPELGYLNLPKKTKVKTGKGRNGRLNSSCKVFSATHFHSEGSLDGAVLLCLGISIGIISSFITNTREVNKLKDLLKQTENLVQDLEEELEMKDSVTVQEIVKEKYHSQDTCDNSFDMAPVTFSPEQHVEKYDGRNSYVQKEEESSEAMSKIEAELEAQLEMLGLNMTTSITNRRSIDLAELDPELMADFARGELRADLVGGLSVAQTKSNEEASGTSPTHCCDNNYAVSPRELSLRLHEVIQSRLEERVQELETALQNSQRKVQIVELKHKDSGRDFSDSHIHSTIQGSTNSEEKCRPTAEPLVMNLSGEALDAYNEAYEELMKFSESEEEDSPSHVFEAFTAESASQTQSEEINGSTRHFAFNKEEMVEGETFSFESRVRMLDEEHVSGVPVSNNTSVSGEESTDCDSEMEKQLIMQIVEKTKKGSPVVLNAQKWLLQSVDEQERKNETRLKF